MATLRYLRGFDCLILDTRGKSFYLRADRDEWEFIFRAVAREASEGSVSFDRPVEGIDIEALKREFTDRGGKVTAKVSLKHLDLDIEDSK